MEGKRQVREMGGGERAAGGALPHCDEETLSLPVQKPWLAQAALAWEASARFLGGKLKISSPEALSNYRQERPGLAGVSCGAGPFGGPMVLRCVLTPIPSHRTRRHCWQTSRHQDRWQKQGAVRPGCPAEP